MDDLTSSDVALVLGVSKSSVLRIPATRLPYATTDGGHRRYERTDVEAYAATRNRKLKWHLLDGDGL